MGELVQSIGSIRTRAVVVLMSTFLAGMLGGAALDRFIHRTPPRRPSLAFASRIFDSLGLTPDQRTKVDSIVTVGRDRSDAIFAEMRPRITTAMDSTWGDVRAVLTAEQKTRLDREIERFQRNRRAFGQPEFRGARDRRGPPLDSTPQ